MKKYIFFYKLVIIIWINLITFFLTGCNSSGNPVNIVTGSTKIISYNIKFIDIAEPVLEISTSFISTEPNRVLVKIPDKGVTNLRATANGAPAKIIPAHDNQNNVYIVYDTKKSLITLRYQIKQTAPLPITPASLWYTIINADYFYFTGISVLAFPADLPNRDLIIYLTWNVPKRFKVANSFGVEQTSQVAHLPNIDGLANGLFLGGDFRLASIDSQPTNQVVYTLIRGNWPFSDKEYAIKLNQIFSGINKFWPTGHPKVLLNVILPVAPLTKADAAYTTKARSGFEVGGFSLYNAFILMATTPQPDTDFWQSLNSTAAHEYNHNWIPGKIVTTPENDLGGRWFAEGVNEYMAQILRLRAHNISLSDYVDRSNEVVEKYFTSPAFGEKIDTGQYPPLNKETMYTIDHPYQRGELLAWKLAMQNPDYKQVDMLLLQMLKDAAVTVPEYSDQLIAKYLNTFGILNPLDDIRQYARDGKEIILTGSELGSCVKAKLVPMLRYNIGFDLQKTKQSGKISGLLPDGPAMQAGLSEGEAFTDLKYDYGNPNSFVEITLPNQLKTVKYSPAIPIKVQQYYVDVPLDNIPENCYP